MCVSVSMNVNVNVSVSVCVYMCVYVTIVSTSHSLAKIKNFKNDVCRHFPSNSVIAKFDLPSNDVITVIIFRDLDLHFESQNF